MRKNAAALIVVILVATSTVSIGSTAVAGPTAAEPAPRVVLVAGNERPPSKDRPVVDILERAGIDVLLVDDDTADLRSHVLGLSPAAVLVSSSVVPTKVGAGLTDVPVPLGSWEGWLYDDLDFSTGGPRQQGETAPQSTIAIVADDHPIVDGLDGTVTVAAEETPFSFLLTSDEAAIARRTATSARTTIAAWDTGDPLASGSAPARRVALFPSYATPSALTETGERLILGAVDWLLDSGVDLDPDHDGASGSHDSCPFVFDVLFRDTDADRVGDVCDPSPTASSAATFSPGHSFRDMDVRDAELADMDDDGDLDVVLVGAASDASGSELFVRDNDGKGSFRDASGIGFNDGAVGTAVALGDVDDDGALDAFVATTGPNRLLLGAPPFGLSSSGPLPGSMPSHGVALGDIDGDGDLDAYVANSGPDEVWWNEGTGEFVDSGQRLGSFESRAVALGDTDGDGDLDAYVATLGEDPLWINDGHGLFSLTDGQSLVDSTDVRLVDLDHDDDLDLVLGGVSGDPKEIRRNVGGRFELVQALDSQPGGHFTSLDVGDLDGNGTVDLFVGSSDGAAARVWLNAGDATFADSGQVIGSNAAAAVALGDVDGDRDLDAVVADSAPGNQVWINNGSDGPAPRAVMIAGNTVPPSGDLQIRDRVLAAGFEVAIVDDDERLDALDLDDVDLLLISSSVQPAEVGSTFAAAPVPVITWEGYGFDDMGIGLARSRETPTTTTQITIADPAHPLGGGLAAGNATVYRTPHKLSFARTAGDAEVIAHVPGQPQQAVVFGYRAGALLVDGTTAASARVALFPTYDGAKVLTGTGLELVDAAIEWATGAASLPEPPAIVWGVTGDGGVADIAVDPGGVAHVAGTVSGTATFDGATVTSAGSTDALLVEIAPDGSVLGASRFGGGGIERATSVALGPDGSRYMAGWFEDPTSFGPFDLAVTGPRSMFLAKIDAAGAVEWALDVGSPGSDTGMGVAADSLGNVYLTGHLGGPVTIGSTDLTPNGIRDILLAKYDASGSPLWAIRMGGSDDLTEDEAHGVVVDGDDEVFVHGSIGETATFDGSALTVPASGGGSAFIAKFDPQGIVQWGDAAGTMDSDLAQYWGLAVDEIGNAYAVGRFGPRGVVAGTELTATGSSDLLWVKYSPEGDVLWFGQAGGPDLPGGVEYLLEAALVEGRLWTTGSVQSNTVFAGVPLDDASTGPPVLGIDASSGEAVTATGGVPSFGRVMAAGPDGSLYVGGRLREPMMVNGSSLGPAGFFVGRYDPTG